MLPSAFEMLARQALNAWLNGIQEFAFSLREFEHGIAMLVQGNSKISRFVAYI